MTLLTWLLIAVVWVLLSLICAATTEEDGHPASAGKALGLGCMFAAAAMTMLGAVLWLSVQVIKHAWRWVP